MPAATIVCDASFCHATKAAGYGVWVASDRGKRPFLGPIKGASNSNTAEVIAVSKALYHALESGLVKYGDTVMIQTDCLGAINLYKYSNHRNEKEVEAYNWFSMICKKYKIEVQFRHVKGHSNKEDARFICQAYCDERAKKSMRLERSRIRLEQIKKNVLEPAKQAQESAKVGRASAARVSVDEPSDRELRIARIHKLHALTQAYKGH